MADITVRELKERLDRGEAVCIIDVREPYEYQTSNLGGKLVPLGSLPQVLGEGELDEYKEQEVVLMCRSGGRSGSAVAYLRQMGFQNVRNLAGGMLAWKVEVDPALPVA